jgi:3-deoxy-D-manno-octulosonic-acid transferase
LLAARTAGVPVAVVNGKLSEKSLRRHRWSRVVPMALRHVALVAVQTAEHASRFAALGVPTERLAVTGNMKYDLTMEPETGELRSTLRERLGCTVSDLLVVGGSLHPQEDQDLLTAYAAIRDSGQPARLVIVPRYPDQAEAVMENVRRAGFRAIAYSRIAPNSAVTADPDGVVVVDTLGDLRLMYAAADVAFVGGSLYYRGANKGGHNLMEPAILGLPVVFGPYNFSFRETVADLLAADAGLLVRDREELRRTLVELAASASRRAELGQRARSVVLNGQGASARNLELLLPLLGARSCSASTEDAQCRHQSSSHPFNE